jgi:putative (di)nucleoside polyphosphate hydrolase
VTASRSIPEGYRPCVGIALFDRRGRVFFAHRAGFAAGEGWQLPQGGMDPGEAALDAAIRELREETGVSSVRLLSEAPVWLSYDLPQSAIRASWKGRYRGQSQKWFAFGFDGQDDEIDVLTPAVGHKPEFDAWRWGELAEAPDLIVPFKRAVYAEMVKLFAGFAERP